MLRSSIQLMKANELARPSGRLTLPDDQVYRNAEKHRPIHIDDHRVRRLFLALPALPGHNLPDTQWPKLNPLFGGHHPNPVHPHAGVPSMAGLSRKLFLE